MHAVLHCYWMHSTVDGPLCVVLNSISREQVVYNLSLGESELQMLLPWLLNINARAPSSPVLVVGTHADKLSDDEFKRRCPLMREKLREMLRRPGFPMDVSFAEVSCFDERQMAELRKKIKTLIDKSVT